MTQPHRRISGIRKLNGLHALILGCLVLTLSHAAMAEGLAAIPDAQSQARAKVLVNEVYADLIDAKTEEDQLAAARLLILRAQETEDDLAAKYVMYDTARFLAVKAGDTEAAMDAIDGLASSFDNPEGGFTNLAAAALQDLTRKAGSESDHAAIAQAGVTVIDQLIEADRQDEAFELLGRLRSSAMRSRRSDLANTYKEMLEDLRVVRTEADRIASDLKAIEKNPDDPALNLSVGKYFTLYRGDWQKGLPMLAKSSDAVLAAVAKADLAGGRSTKEQVEIGDRWWAVASKRPTIESRAITERAKHWYRLALPASSGIERAVLTKKLDLDGKVKWGDLVLERGIWTAIEIDEKTAAAKPGPVAAKASWEMKNKPAGVERQFTIHFEGYLYSPRATEVDLVTETRACVITVEVNGDPVVSGHAVSAARMKLIKGYNLVRGSIMTKAAVMNDPATPPYAELKLSDSQGNPVEIPADQWFRDTTR